MNQYNFVILGSKNEIFKTSFKDVACQENVVYLDDDISCKGFLYKILHRLHFSKVINKLVSIPFKNIWNAGNVVFSFNNAKPICFILFTNWVQSNAQTGIIPFLRKKYPGCKIVWFAQDILCTIRNTYTRKRIDVDSLKKFFDLIVSYDMGDAKKYGLEYHPTVLSKTQVSSNSKYKSDLFFIGKSKKRLNLLIELGKGLKKYGIKYNFMVLGIPPEEQKEPEYINYIDKPLTYYENLNYAANAKCLLELMQPGAVGYTFRTSEALLYNKKMITNNQPIEKAPFFNDENIVIMKDISEEWLKQVAQKILDDKSVQYENTEVISPKHLLEFIEEKLG